MSLGALATDSGIFDCFDDRAMVLLDGKGTNLGHAKLKNGLFHLLIEHKNRTSPAEHLLLSRQVIVNAIDFDDPVWKMHRRLGHLSFQNMFNLCKFSEGMRLTEKQIKAKLKAVCLVCATTRALVKIPRDLAKRHTQVPGELMHADVWGPYPIKGFDTS